MTSPEFPELIGFPRDENTLAQLAWLEQDYIEYILNVLHTGFHRQDPEAKIVAMRNEQPILYRSVVRNDRGVLCEMEVLFKLQVLLQDAQHKHWRLYADLTVTGEGLDETDTVWIQTHVELLRDEPAD